MRKNNLIFQKKKNVVLFLYGYACQLCGLISVNNHVHHIDGDNGNNFSINLVPLCSACHRFVHKLNIKVSHGSSASLLNQLSLLDTYL